jgi:hypothetical protein
MRPIKNMTRGRRILHHSSLTEADSPPPPDWMVGRRDHNNIGGGAGSTKGFYFSYPVIPDG